MYRGKLTAACESIFSNAGYRTGYGDAGQAFTAIKSIIRYVLNVVGFCVNLGGDS